MTALIGQPIRRKEDRRLLTGSGRFTDDINLPSQAYAAVLRSPHAHARIVSIDTAAARRAPGVLAVLTGSDYAADGLKPLQHGPNGADHFDDRQARFRPRDDAARRAAAAAAARRRIACAMSARRSPSSWQPRSMRRATRPSSSKSPTNPCRPSPRSRPRWRRARPACGTTGPAIFWSPPSRATAPRPTPLSPARAVSCASPASISA